MNDRVILLVEDNPNDAELTLRAFKRCGVMNPIVVARDGVEALDFLFSRDTFANREPSGNPQVVLLDLKLPKIDGLEVLKAIREDTRTRMIPVVILSSSNEEQDVLAGYGLGANSFVRKPVDFAKFVDAARQLGLYWLLVNEPVPDRQ